jgi:DNA polymerase-3 subunit delta
VPELKPVYLIHGEDDVRIDAWRSRVRARAEAEGGPGALETFEAKTSRPEEVAAALQELTFSTGERFLLAEGVEAWKSAAVGPLVEALGDMPPDTVLVLVARGKPAQPLIKAAQKAGGEVRECAAPKPWEMHRWAAERAREEGLQLDGEAAKALTGLVGTRQQRLAREVEKLAIMAHPATQLTAEEVERSATGDLSAGAYDLADALVAGDVEAALALAEELTSRDDRPGKLVWPIVRRLRDVHRAACLLDAGVPEKQVASELAMSSWAAKRTIGKAKKADRHSLERALGVFADLEVEIRGGGELDEDTAFSLALAEAAGARA